ncbi:MAG: hemolysin III family protein, partial [Clostridia bacterium]|nr:hemolysin III family protein [Clostridia bacterium]
TIGGVIYMIKKPNIGKQFGFHELFHVFILAGSFSHYMMTFLYLS